MSITDEYTPEIHPDFPNPEAVVEHISAKAYGAASDVLSVEPTRFGDRQHVIHEVEKKQDDGMIESSHLLATGPTPELLEAGSPQPIRGLRVDAARTISRSTKSRDSRFRRNRTKDNLQSSESSVIVTPATRTDTASERPASDQRVAEITRRKPTDLVNPTVLSEVIQTPDGAHLAHTVRVGDDGLGRPVVEVVRRDGSLDDPNTTIETMRSRQGDTSVEALETERLAIEVAGRVIKNVVTLQPVS